MPLIDLNLIAVYFLTTRLRRPKLSEKKDFGLWYTMVDPSLFDHFRVNSKNWKKFGGEVVNVQSGRKGYMKSNHNVDFLKDLVGAQEDFNLD